MADNKLKHLEIIQSTISRMASNSFLLRGWAVTLIVALLAFANTKEMDQSYSFLALIPLAFFWSLDSYYVYQERLFRKLYDKVRSLNEMNVDFTMDTTEFKNSKMEILRAYITGIPPYFYLPILVVILIVIFASPFQK